MKHATKATALIGSLVLLLTSGFHLTGLPMAETAASEISSSFMASSMSALWTMPSSHWILIAILAAIATWWPSRFSKIFLFGATCIVWIDAAMMLAAIGPFAGELMLAITGLLYAIAAIRIKSNTG